MKENPAVAKPNAYCRGTACFLKLCLQTVDGKLKKGRNRSIAQHLLQPSNLPQGNLHVTVARDGQLIMDGEYAYDLTQAQIVTNGDGIEISLWTKAELIAHDQQGNIMHRSNYGYKVRFDAQAIAANPQLANAKYVSFKWNNIYIENSMPGIWTKEATKFSWNRFWAVHELKRIDQFESTPYTHLFLGSNSVEEVRNQYMYVFAFDANKQLIGYYIHTVNFDADHVGSHVTLVPPIPIPQLP